MPGARIYLDYNATSPARPEALAAFLRAAERGGNASSVHGEGRAAHAALEAARRDVGRLVGATRPEQVVFTSGATEALNLALAPADASERLILSAGEHAAVLGGHRFPGDRVERVPLTADGVVDLDALRRALRTGGPACVALQAANNETGVLQPLREAAGLIHAAGGRLVCDAVQAPGRVACDGFPADIVVLSGHKVGAVPGAGACVLLTERAVVPLLRGGGQERGRRAGTENVPAAASFGAATARLDHIAEGPRLGALRDAFESRLRDLAPDVTIFGETVARLPNTSAFAVPGVAAERLLMALDLDGVAVSSGSACASGVVGRSHVLEAMGVDADLRCGAIRVSFGWASSRDDVEVAAAVLARVLGRMRRPMRSAA